MSSDEGWTVFESCGSLDVVSDPDGSFIVLRCVLQDGHDGPCARCVSHCESHYASR